MGRYVVQGVLDAVIAGTRGHGVTVGLLTNATSFSEPLTVSVTACREQMPDPSFYAACLESSFRELREASVA